MDIVRQLAQAEDCGAEEEKQVQRLGQDGDRQRDGVWDAKRPETHKREPGVIKFEVTKEQSEERVERQETTWPEPPTQQDGQQQHE